jgi:hypothetical protein
MPFLYSDTLLFHSLDMGKRIQYALGGTSLQTQRELSTVTEVYISTLLRVS